MREEYLETVADYKNRLESFMADLEKLGTWKQVERSVVANFAFGKTGVIYVFVVCENGCSKGDIMSKQSSL